MKRIVTCSDGTWNRPDNKDRGINVKTNVAKMYEAICSKGKNGVEQVKIYDQGVGTGPTLKDKIVGGATGLGLDRHIKDMYTFFVLNYNSGDEIYLFGFSRGAYTARSVTGFIRNCGILKPEYIHLVDKAYGLYRDRNEYTLPDSDLMKSFRKAYCAEDITPIHFIGVWDTVGSLGIPLPMYKMANMNKYKFHDVTLSSTVKNAFHALAIDERRSLFSPTLWKKSKTVVSNPEHEQQLEQRWFAGVHSNVGGGYADCALSNLTLDWLMKKAESVGLCFNDPPLITPNPDYDKGEIRNSYSAMYWLWRPRWRAIDVKDAGSNQTIDESVRERYKDSLKKYKPGNLAGFDNE